MDTQGTNFDNIITSSEAYELEDLLPGTEYIVQVKFCYLSFRQWKVINTANFCILKSRIFRRTVVLTGWYEKFDFVFNLRNWRDSIFVQVYRNNGS